MRIRICFSFVFAMLSLMICSSHASAQCLSGLPSSATTLYPTTGNVAVDEALREESLSISSVFGVSPRMYLFEDGYSPNAFADPSANRVYLGKELLVSELWSMNKGGAAVAGIVAHEYAHILQGKKMSKLSWKYRELQADFMAGYYLAKKDSSYSLTGASVSYFAESLFEKGDYNFWDPKHHGTPTERVSAFLAGYKSVAMSLDDAFRKGEKFVTGDADDTGDDTGSDTDDDSTSPAPAPVCHEVTTYETKTDYVTTYTTARVPCTHLSYACYPYYGCGYVKQHAYDVVTTPVTTPVTKRVPITKTVCE